MRHTLTIAMSAFVLSASAVAPPQAPTMKVPVPSGFESFHPAIQGSAIAEALPDGSRSRVAPLRAPRFHSRNLPAPLHTAPAAGHLYGFLANTNLADLKYGMYDVDPATGQSQFLWQDELTAWQWTTYTGWMRDGNLCGVAGVKLDGAFMGYAWLEYDINDGTILDIEYIDLENSKLPVLVSSAYRVYDDKVYTYNYNEEGDGFCFSVAPATNVKSVYPLRDVNIKDVCAAMTYDSQTDTMYGVTTDGRFVSIDREGNLTTIYDISRSIPNLQPSTATGLAWSPSAGGCIYDAYILGQGTAFYLLDPNAKAPKRLGSSAGAEIFTVLVSPEVNAQGDAPQQATLRSYDFTATDLNGSLTWTLPSRLVEGTSIQGTVDWELLVDGNPMDKGTAAPGKDIVAKVSAVSNGADTYDVVCSVEGYRGEPAILHRWTGADAPIAPGNVRLTEDKVTWNVPTGSVHDGYVDYSDLSYDVYLNGGKIGTTRDTSLSYTLPQGQPFTSYTAEVVATYKGWASPTATSNFITYGDPLRMPVHFRPLEKQLEMMTLINVDGRKLEDGSDDTWFFTTEMGFPAFASGHTAEDWLILPPMQFDNTEKAYRFEMEIGLVHDRDTSGTYEVCIGTAPTAEAMTRVIIPESHCEHMLGDILEEFFAIPEPGTYYIGIHTKTGQVSFHVSDIDISLSERSAEVPTGVTGLSATAAAEGKLSASVEFTLPLTTASGRAIPADKEMDVTVSSYATEPGYNKDRELVETKKLTGKPGDVVKLDIATAQNYNVITVECAIDGLPGKAEETMIYTGIDRPYLVENLRVSVSEDNMSMTLTWDPPTEGEENGPIGDSFLYVIYYYSSGWTYFEEAGWDVTSYTYTCPDGSPVGYVLLGVMAYNAAGLSYHVAGLSAAIGEPMTVPWTNNLDNDITDYNTVIVRPTDQYDDTYWVMGNPGSMISPIFDLPSGWAFIGYTNESVDRKTSIALPKMRTTGLNDVTLTFDYWGGRYAAPMRLYAETRDSTEPILIAELPQDADGWTSHTVTLPAELQDCQWFMPMVDADLPDDQYFAMFSGYSFGSVSGVSLNPGNPGSISGGRGTLTVSGYAGETLRVTDLNGRTVLLRDRIADHCVFMLPAGVYAVQAGQHTAKVLVR
ncbi:MAG: fibronectin type III domain-containing protein [Muribaculaceae bacterium]|nr:fibronectin type III domain-containing protein [Muribaculaceae bacterium]